jgi:hypothetical protein
VALLVIVCGALLMIGGAISLLMGFDIVMTERGSAMTLGGTIALSGGVIAVGIGFALLRLSQILAALQERNVQGVRPAVTPDRPVVPLAPPESVQPEPAPPEAMPPLPISEPGASRVGIGAGAVAAGVAASAAVVAAGYSSATSGAETPGSGAASPPGHDAVDEGVVTIRGMFELSPRDNAPDAVAPGPPQGSIPDLEEELARALAEPGSAPPPLAAREKSFSDGLSDLLGKPKSRKRKDVPGQQTEPDAVPGPETGLETTPVALPSPEPVAEPETVVAETDESIANPDLPVGTPVAIPAEAAGDAVAPEPEVAEVDMAETTHSADELTEADLMVAPPPAPVLPSRKVLGTYNAGGRTYSMYADGSVEAVTELGVERFSSMDELRRHLVKA